MNPEPKRSRTNSFQWDAERRFPLIFIGLVLLSFLAHIAAFFLFQVTYPQRVTIPPLAPQVTVLSPDLPEHQPLLAWVAAEDPALIAATARAVAPGIQQVQYQPSYATVRTWPRPAPQLIDPVPLPSGRSGLEVIDSANYAVPDAGKQLPPVKTAITISGALASRAIQGSFEIAARATSPLEPVQFLLGVSDTGQIRFSFLHVPSGNQEIDDAAVSGIAKLSFSPGTDPITWGFITINWGDELYTSPTTPQPPR